MLIDHDLGFYEACSLKVPPDSVLNAAAGVTVVPDKETDLVCFSVERDVVYFQHPRAKKLRVGTWG